MEVKERGRNIGIEIKRLMDFILRIWLGLIGFMGCEMDECENDRNG